MSLYAQINKETKQMIGSPTLLPNRFTTPEGATVSSFDKLPDAALAGLGWVPVVYADLPSPETHYHSLSPAYEADSSRFVFQAVARDISVLLSEAEKAIDAAAGEACARHVSQGCGQEMRYLEKSKQAKEFAAAYDTEQNPSADDYPVIKKEAERCGVTVIEKAREIIICTNNWIALASEIESLRMGGKVACRASTDTATLVARRDEALAALEAI